MQSIAILVLFLALCGSVISKTRFNRPPPGTGEGDDWRDNAVYTEGRPEDFDWLKDDPLVDIILWQRYPKAQGSSTYREYLARNSSLTYYSWTPKMSLNGPPPPAGDHAVFWVGMYNVSETATPIADSHFFNVTRTSTTTTSQPTSSPTVTSTSTALSTTSAIPAGSAPDHGGLSTGAVVGIAIGATLAGIILISVCAFFLWRHFQSKKQPEPATDGPDRGDTNDKATPALTTSEFGTSMYAQPDPGQRPDSLATFNHHQSPSPPQGTTEEVRRQVIVEAP